MPHSIFIIVQVDFRAAIIFVYWRKNDNMYQAYSDVSIKNIDILPNRQYIANTADSAQEQYS